MISNLPSDLVSEILSRVPLKSLRAVRLTCKKWNDLSKTQSFRKMHIGKASAAAKEGESQMMAMMGNNLYLTSIVFNGDPSAEQKGKLTCPDEQVKVSLVYHCDGLLLCVLDDDSKVLVWNPYLGEKRWIEPRYSHRPYGRHRFAYALGYEDKESCRSFKLLRFIDYYHSRAAPGGEPFYWYEMYDFDSDSWTTLDVTPRWRISFSLCDLSVSLKGNTYWCAAERSLEDDQVSFDRIICFDFTRERFGQLLPLPFSGTSDDYATLSCVRDEKLAVLLQHNESNPYELDIWITTKIEAEEVSWCKFLRVETGFDEMVPYIGDGFLIDEEKRVAIGFDEDNRKALNIIGDGGYFRHLTLHGEEPRDANFSPSVFPYVPSSVEIKQQHAGGERRQQRELEDRRYDKCTCRLD